MPSQQIPAAPVVSRRHAKLLQHLVENGGGGYVNAAVKDLRIRRVVPPASAPPSDCASSPDPPAAAKPVPAATQIQAQSTPPEPSAAAAAEDRERKPALPRSKLVRDPASFGYRRLLPFLNQMAANNGSGIKNTPSETKIVVPVPITEPSRSDADESVEELQSGAAPVADPVEPVAVEDAADRETKDCSDTVTEDAKVVPTDLQGTKPGLARCARSKFVHHPGSLGYKRMLPFLMENEISSQEEDRAKIRRVSEEEHISSESDVSGNGHHHLAVPKGSPEERNGARVDREVILVSDANCVGPVHADAVELFPDDSGTVEAQRVAPQEEMLASVGGPLSSEKSGVTSDRSAVPAGELCQPAVLEDSPQETTVAQVQTTAEEKEALKSDESVPVDLASSKPGIKRCMRSRFVHHPSSFSYKRMLPFLMQNDISSQEGDRAKLPRLPEEKQLTSDESDVMGTGDHHLLTLKGSAEAGYRAEVERIVEEITTAQHGNYLLKGGQLQSAVAEVSLDRSTEEVHKVTQEEVLSSDKDELASVDGVLAGAQCQLVVSDDLPRGSNVAETERVVKSDEKSVLDGTDLQSAVSEVSPQEDDTEKEVTKKLAQLAEDEESRPIQLCQSAESGCPDVGFGSPTNIVMVDGEADQHGAQERQDSAASPDALLLDVGMICKHSDPCASDAPLSAEEISGCLTQAESGLRKVGMLHPCGSPVLETQCHSPKKLSPVSGALGGASCLKKRVVSPKRLSPKKGILKRNTMGCRGICMCLDCSVFRLRADRAFEFSRKQMQEADDIIGNLLEEVSSLRSLAKQTSGQQEQHIEEACQRASLVEEVARERRQQMQVELTAHCKIPGPRVKFAQYVDEKMASSPRCSGSSRRQSPL